MVVVWYYGGGGGYGMQPRFPSRSLRLLMWHNPYDIHQYQTIASKNQECKPLTSSSYSPTFCKVFYYLRMGIGNTVLLQTTIPMLSNTFNKNA